MDEEKLILEVENHKIIYDVTDPFYKDNHKKDNAWNAISAAVGVDVDVCKSKWRTLRDGFVKNRKKVLSSGSAGGPAKDWKYKDIMSFLLPHLQPRSNIGAPPADEERSLTPLSFSGSDEQASTSAAMRPPSVTAETQPSTSGERDRPQRSRSPRQARADTRRGSQPPSIDTEERLISALREPDPKPQTALDESYYFALSLVPMLTKLDDDKRQQAKIGILNLLVTLGKSTAPQQPPT